ncbi:MAG: glycosyltransferase family 2 protein [Candidatus Latescibacterota bacterium]|nr:MAG: glycosyltransferase family 2 protein [Candidatus Latescibacterota bacterium]
MPRISTIVITFNEERNIARCLQSVETFSDEIIVLDSNSTDQTVEIARGLGARVITNDWPGYGKQKQLALEHATHSWVFSIDADEEVSPELGREIRSLDFSMDGYEMPRAVWYLNRWIKHGVWYPGYILRLFRRDKGSFTDDAVHEFVRVSGKVGRLHGDLLHYTYRDIHHHIEKMNDFTLIAAREMNEKGRRAGFRHIAVYPLLEFFKVYISKRGFLDGLAGVVVSVFHAFYVCLKYAKLHELGLRSQSLDADHLHSTDKTDTGTGDDGQ